MERKEIELIPKEVEATRERERKIRISRLVGFGFLGLSVLILALLLSLIGIQTVTVNSIRRQISEKETRIGELATTEEKVVALTGKSDAMTQIFGGRSYYSILLEALEESIPSGVGVTGFSAGETEATVGLSGETQSYIDLAKFLENLVDSEMGGSVFSQVALTSVTFDPATEKAEFVAEATVVKANLKKGWEVLLE